MAISTILQIADQMTGPLRSIHAANLAVLEDFREMGSQTITVDAEQATKEIAGMAEELMDAGEAQDTLRDKLRETSEEQERFNDSLGRGQRQTESFSGSVQKLVKAFAGFAGFSAMKGYVTDAMAAFDVQNNAEKQLKTVLYNVQAAPGAFDSLAATASNIQGHTIYGDESMLAGAGEIATYISDTAAIEKVMGTLTNYAAGMSGGGELNPQQMVEYATQLGKALNGTYDGLKDRGFELTKAQQKIIETGTDMEKALVIDDVINQSWANLAEQMANTPQGQIIQFKNNLGDISEVVGGRVYPAVMELFSAANQNMPQIESAMMIFADGAALVVYGLSEIVSAAGSVYAVIADNWGIIGPIVYGAAGAFLVYNGVLLAHKGYLAMAAAWQSITATATTIMAIRAGTATAAQASFNMVLLASPITWFAGGVLLGVVALYSFIGMLNQAMGTTYSATGIIAGAFATMGTVIVRIFLWFGDIALGVLQGIAEAVDFVMDTDYAGAVAGWRENLSGFAKEKFDLSEAFGKGYDWGKALPEKLGKLNPLENLNLDKYQFDVGRMSLPEVSDPLGDIADDTGSIKKSLEISEEELKYLRDIAEREVINRFTTAEIKVEMHNNNQISGTDDLDGILDALEEKLYEGMIVAAEGV